MYSPSPHTTTNLPLGLCDKVCGYTSQLPISLTARGSRSPSLISISVSIHTMVFNEWRYTTDTGNKLGIQSYHLVYMNTSILLVERQVILNRITGFKSKNIPKCAFKAKTRRAQCAWCIWCACVSKVLPQTGNTVPYYLFDYGNTENINLHILLGCLVV